MRAVLAGVAVAAVFATPAFADYCIIQQSSTKRCRIVEERPSPGIGIMIGERGFGVRVEAERHMRTVEVCRETVGRGARDPEPDIVIIDRR